MYIVIETDGCYSDKEWAVRGLYNNIKDASIFAWTQTLLPYKKIDFYVQYWCKTSKISKETREKCREVGKQFHIIEWDVKTNMHIGTWYLKFKSYFIEIGEKGDKQFRYMIENFLSTIDSHVPGKLWHDCMKFEENVIEKL